MRSVPPSFYTPHTQHTIQAACQQHVVVWVKGEAGDPGLATVFDPRVSLLGLVQLVNVIDAQAAVIPAPTAVNITPGGSKGNRGYWGVKPSIMFAPLL